MKKLILVVALVLIASYAYAEKITIDIPDEKVPKVVESYCVMFQYDQTKLADETKGHFVKRMIAVQIKSVYQQYIAHQITAQKQEELRAAINETATTVESELSGIGVE